MGVSQHSYFDRVGQDEGGHGAVDEVDAAGNDMPALERPDMGEILSAIAMPPVRSSLTMRAICKVFHSTTAFDSRPISAGCPCFRSDRDGGHHH